MILAGERTWKPLLKLFPGLTFSSLFFFDIKKNPIWNVYPWQRYSCQKKKKKMQWQTLGILNLFLCTLRGRISENSDFGVTVRLWPVVVHKQKCFAFCVPELYFPLVSACWLGPRERTKLAKSSEWPAVENQCCWLLSGRAVAATLGQAISPPWGLWQALPGRSLKEMLGHDDLQLLMPDEYALEVLQSHGLWSKRRPGGYCADSGFWLQTGTPKGVGGLVDEKGETGREISREGTIGNISLTFQNHL